MEILSKLSGIEGPDWPFLIPARKKSFHKKHSTFSKEVTLFFLAAVLDRGRGETRLSFFA